MAEKNGDKSERRRNRGRRIAPVIEMTAAEITTPEPAQPAADPSQAQPAAPVAPEAPSAAAETPPATPAPPQEPEAPRIAGDMPPTDADIIQPPAPPAPTEARYALPVAAAAVVGGIFGAIAGAVIPGMFGGEPAVDAARVIKLETALVELQRRPVAAAPSNAAELQALTQRLAAMEADVKRRLEAQDQKIASVPAPASAPAAPVDLRPLTERMGTLDRALAATDQKAEAARAAAADSLKQGDPRLQDLSARLTQMAERVERTAAAPIYGAAQALGQAFQRGAPFAAEIAALEALGFKSDQMQALKALAPVGAPPVQRLAEQFQPLAMDVARAGQPAPTGLRAMLDSVVRTRASGPGAADSPEGLVAAIEAALKAGDLTAALAAWEKLPAPARKASEAWAAAAQQREAAQKAVRDVQDAALAALRKAAP
jgi:hypothetical protein